MKAEHMKIARMLMIAFLLALTLTVGHICLASGHECGCGDSLCPICQLLESCMIPAVAVVAALAFVGTSAARRPVCAVLQQVASLVCFRIRLDD